MEASVSKKLGSPDLPHSTITLCAWANHPSYTLDLYRNYPITIFGKTISIDINVIDALLDYNILLGHSYTYDISVVTSMVFCKMCFPHNGMIITINQLTYYDPKSQTSP